MKAYKDDSNSTRIAVLETVIGQINQTILRLENKIDHGFSNINIKFDQVDKKFEKIDDKIEKMNDKIDVVKKENTSHFRTTIFTLLTLIGSPLLIESIKLLNKFVRG